MIKENPLKLKNHLEQTYGRPVDKIFFIGIGGSSMSGLAALAFDAGFAVEGSDMAESLYTKKLLANNVPIHIGHDPKNIGSDTDLVVYSAAIHDDNPDMVRAAELGIPRVERADFLGLISDTRPKTIGVAGTHGKTTTSSMVATMLARADMDPTVSIGGMVPEIGGNSRLGKSDYFVLESCEFVGSFLKTRHDIGIITNIEPDHLEYYTGGLPQIIDAFHTFGDIIPDDGLMIAWGDSEEVRSAVDGLDCQVMTYGFDKTNDWTAENITFDDTGFPAFDAIHDGELYGHFKLLIPGKHNVLNALAAIALGDYLGVDQKTVTDSINTFPGAKRRFDFDGSVDGIKVYDDYAHHPTEIKVVIDACKNLSYNNFWVVFQPFPYSRIHFLFDDFVDALKDADKIVLTDIYEDRETNEWDIYSEDLAKRIKAVHHVPTVVFSTFEMVTKFLVDNAEPDDLILVIGCETINRVAYMTFDALKERYPNAAIVEPK